MNRSTCHPAVWCVLLVPFGAVGGFVGVALTFLANRRGISITDTAFLAAASIVIQWLKWLWAPLVDITLTPRRWYVLSTLAIAATVLAMAAIPLGPSTLWTVIAVVVLNSVAASVSAMAVDAMVALSTPREQLGRVSGWMQAGNLGGTGVGGGVSLLLLDHLPEPWMGGAMVAVLLVACMAPLRYTPGVASQAPEGTAWSAVRWAALDVWQTLRQSRGRIAALLLVLPIGTGAASTVLAQASVAAHWHAGANEVAVVQGLLGGLAMATGSFAGGWLGQRVRPRTAYALAGFALTLVAWAMALAPTNVATYLVASLAYNVVVGAAFAAFTAVVLDAIGYGAAATKCNVLASLSNFPIWWMGLLLAWIADHEGPAAMLTAEAAIGLAALAVFLLGASRIDAVAKRREPAVAVVPRALD
ncbi:MAG TPA: MFS transporter [Caldimonas sp.]|nr:MFS transporter [Caldimonas sp.]